MSIRHIESDDIYHDEPIYFFHPNGHTCKVSAVQLWDEVQYINFDEMVKEVEGSKSSFLKRVNKDELFAFEFGRGTSSKNGLYLNISEAHELLRDSRAKGAQRLAGMLAGVIVDRAMRNIECQRRNGESHWQASSRLFNDFLDRESDIDDLTAFLDDDTRDGGI